jgi:GNAT superfamily N-acetyltransferase
MKIRPATPDDAPALSRLFAQLGYPKHNEPAQLPPRLERIEALGDACLVAENDAGEVIALAGLHVVHVLHYAKPLGYITAFVVDDSVRRQGVGRKLLDAATDWARAKGCYRLSLTSAEKRSDAHAFYPASGFPMTGRRFGKDL